MRCITKKTTFKLGSSLIRDQIQNAPRYSVFHFLLKNKQYFIFSRPYFALHMGWTRKTWLFIRFETHTFLHWSASFEGCSIIWQRSFCSENCLFTPDWRLCCGFQWWQSGFSVFFNCQLRSKCKIILNYGNYLAFYKAKLYYSL